MTESRLRTELTTLLTHVEGGGEGAVERIVPLLYGELHAMAHRQLAREAAGHTLQTTALVHEAYLKLLDGVDAGRRGRTYFFAAAGRAMRQVLVDHARRRNAGKRGGGASAVTLGDADLAVDALAVELIDLNRALQQLGELDERYVRVIECRYFAGLSVEETAEALGVSPRTVKYDWSFARAWLYDALRDAREAPAP
jgi:RNA polymerase sigma factor (TIGR02999 family)